MNRRFSVSVVLVLALGVLYTLALQSLLPAQEVFFSGDGGEKAMQMRQYAAGQFHVDLRLARNTWTEDLWRQGLLPLDLTFFVINDKVYSIFPYTFPFVTAPFYAAFGMRGVCLIPLASVWCLWLAAAMALRRIDPNPLRRAGLLAALIFACPITLYSATYWEHPVAAALSFIGFLYTLGTEKRRDSMLRAALFGITLGVAGWFREECMVFAAIVLAVSFFHTRRFAGNRAWFAYAAGTSFTILGYIALNVWIYGNPLGTHSIQRGIDVPIAQRVYNAANWSFEMYESYLHTMPIVLFGAGLFVALLRLAPRRLDREAWALMAVVAVSLIGTGAIVPSHGDYQIGPRFLFPIVPVAWLLIAKWWREVDSLRVPVLRIGFACVFLITLALGVKRDAIDGAMILRDNYSTRVAPALDMLLSRPETAVAVSNQAVSQELGVAMKDKDFFLVKTAENWEMLATAVRERDDTGLLFIALGDETTEFDSVIRSVNDAALSITQLGRYGRHFYFYTVRFAN
ncbi:MAG: hypothetical protein K1Y02_26110 [Candidatus Hydrogenedentes bacterium]|nr:hypothetical protein [Candidatus Hydrogenedentota bacterium]